MNNILKLEHRVLSAAISELLSHNFSLSVFDGGEYALRKRRDKKEVLRHLWTCDEEWLIVYDGLGARLGALYLIYGECGWDVVCDYSTVLEPFLSSTKQLIQELSNAR